MAAGLVDDRCGCCCHITDGRETVVCSDYRDSGVHHVVLFAIFLWMVYVYVDWRNDIFMLTLTKLSIWIANPGKTCRRSAPLENVLSIEYERLGFGVIYLILNGLHCRWKLRLSFDHVYNPSRVQEDIFYRMGERLETVRQFEIDAERERFSEWIATYHRKAAESQATRRQVRGKINPSE